MEDAEQEDDLEVLELDGEGEDILGDEPIRRKGITYSYPPIVSAGFCDAIMDDKSTVINQKPIVSAGFYDAIMDGKSTVVNHNSTQGQVITPGCSPADGAASQPAGTCASCEEELYNTPEEHELNSESQEVPANMELAPQSEQEEQEVHGRNTESHEAAANVQLALQSEQEEEHELNSEPQEVPAKMQLASQSEQKEPPSALVAQDRANRNPRHEVEHSITASEDLD